MCVCVCVCVSVRGCVFVCWVVGVWWLCTKAYQPLHAISCHTLVKLFKYI